MMRRFCPQPITIGDGKVRHLFLLLMAPVFVACAGLETVGLSPGHIAETATPVTPPPVVQKPVVEPPVKKPEAVQTYSVAVKDVPVEDLLFSLARDADLDVDIQTTINTTVTLNAIERPLQEILGRIAEQAGLRYQIRGSNLLIKEDLPYWHNYSVDYVNVSRKAESEVGVATQIATSGGSVSEDSGQQSDDQGNLSKTIVKNNSSNDFWASLEAGLLTIVADRTGDGSTPTGNNPVVINAMSGVATVLGTQAQHQRIQTYLDRIMMNAKRQVLIEMTIVEVKLSDNYQAGVDWQRLAAVAADGWSAESNLLGPDLQVAPFVALGYANTDSSGDSIAATVRMLQQFGDTKVLSSPKIMALNNQTALLKVVNEQVYFTVELDIRDATADIPERRTFTSQIHTVPVGLVLSVTPQVSNNGFVSLNIRPTISRITGFAVDPAPRLAGSDFDNLIPEIQVREIESLLQVLDGHTVVLGGLMQNERESQKDGVPGLSRIPGIGRLFSYTRDELIKTELVIFLKPTVISNGMAPEGQAQVGDYYPTSSVSKETPNVAYR